MAVPEKQFTSRNNLEDEKLWESLTEGNEIAFDKLYSRYFNKLYVYGSYLVSDKELIKDSIQELFVELWKNRHSLSKVKYVKTYLHKSFRRKILKAVKKDVFKGADQEVKDSLQVVYSREREMIKEQTAAYNKRCLSKAFQKLSPRQQEVIVLKYYNDFSYQEIASVMSLQKVKSARTFLYRAIDSLRSEMGKLPVYTLTAFTGPTLFEMMKNIVLALLFATF